MRERQQKPKRKRRIKWGRVILFLLVLSVVGTVFFAITRGIYALGEGVYRSCENVITDYQKRTAFQAKLHDPKFSGYTNILFIGTDQGSDDDPASPRQADVMILCSIRKTDGQVELLSIPPNTYTDIPGRRDLNAINQSYSFGEAQLAVRTVESLLEIPVHHYVVMDWKSFVQLVDAIGGVDLYVENDMAYEDPFANFTIHLKRGFQHLDGGMAGQYIRFRSDELGDLGRVQRQQKFLKAAYQQMIHMDTVVKIPGIAELLNTQISTSLAAFDIAKMIKDIGGVRPESMKVRVLPGSTVVVDGKEGYKADQEKLNIILNEMYQNH